MVAVVNFDCAGLKYWMKVLLNHWVFHFCDPGSGTIVSSDVGTWKIGGSHRG